MKRSSFKQGWIFFTLSLLLPVICLGIALPEYIPEINSIVEYIIPVLLFCALILAGFFINRLWRKIRPERSLLTSRFFCIIWGILLYSWILFFSFITGLSRIFTAQYVSHVECPEYNVSIYVYDSSFMFSSTTIKLRRGNSIFLETLVHFSERDPSKAHLDYEQNYVFVSVDGASKKIYLDQPPVTEE